MIASSQNKLLRSHFLSQFLQPQPIQFLTLLVKSLMLTSNIFHLRVWFDLHFLSLSFSKRNHSTSTTQISQSLKLKSIENYTKSIQKILLINGTSLNSLPSLYLYRLNLEIQTSFVFSKKETMWTLNFNGIMRLWCQKLKKFFSLGQLKGRDFLLSSALFRANSRITFK